MTSRPLQPSDVVASFMSAVQDPKKRLDQDYREMALRDLVTMLESNTATRAGFVLDREEKLVSEILALLLRDASMDVRQHAVKAVILLFMFVSSNSQDSICDKVMLMLGERDDKVAASDHGPSPSLMRDAATLTLKGIIASLAAALANSESTSRPAFFDESYSKLTSRVIPSLRGMVHSGDKASRTFTSQNLLLTSLQANFDMMLKALEVLNDALRLHAVGKASNHAQLLSRRVLQHPTPADLPNLTCLLQSFAASFERQSSPAQGIWPLHLCPRSSCVQSAIY
jgi:hypothetical protein